MGRPDHHFNPALAEQYGVNIAIFLHNIFYWVTYNQAYKQNFYENRYWTFNSLEAFCEAHPYWSRRQIERIISSCKENGLLLVGCFNKEKRDRTNWYTLSDEAMAFFTDDTPKSAECISPNGEMDTPKSAECISPNGEMDITKRGNAFHQTVTPLPDNNTTDNSNNTPKAPKGAARTRKTKSEPDWKPERFQKLWHYYPRGENKQAAIRAWDRLTPSDELIDEMARALKRQKQSEDWQAGIGIPYLSTWLNNARWTDRVKQPENAANSGGWAADPEVI